MENITHLKLRLSHVANGFVQISIPYPESTPPEGCHSLEFSDTQALSSQPPLPLQDRWCVWPMPCAWRKGPDDGGWKATNNL